MLTNRRQFMTRSAIGGLGLMATPLIATNPAAGALNSKAARPPVIATHARYYRYSPEGGAREEIAWVHIDLGTIRTIDDVRQNGRAHVLTPVTKQHLVCRFLHQKKK